jgi:hypothetical protein
VNATHAVDIDEIQTTRGEKALAIVLGIFLLVGLGWAYAKLDVRDRSYEPPAALTAEDQAAIARHNAAVEQLAAARAEESRALADLELKRERYRTALDAGQLAPSLRSEYREAERALAATRLRVADAEREVAETQPAADAANARRFDRAQERFLSESRLTFLYRLGFVLAVLGAAYGLLFLLRGSRYFTLALAAVGAGAVLTLFFAGDYVEDYVEWRDTGPVALSAAGIALTLGAFWALQRYLQRRIPLRRLRKGECPFCGFPGSGNPSCEGCGRTIAGSCSHCGERRRVGVLFCGSCGKA